MATYFVSTTGSDSNPGTIIEPWLTWHKGFNSLLPGDTLIIRGGTYVNYTPQYSNYWYPLYSAAYIYGKHGNAVDPIIVINYLDEIPILDGSIITNPTNRSNVFFLNCN